MNNKKDIKQEMAILDAKENLRHVFSITVATVYVHHLHISDEVTFNHIQNYFKDFKGKDTKDIEAIDLCQALGMITSILSEHIHKFPSAVKNTAYDNIRWINSTLKLSCPVLGIHSNSTQQERVA